MRLYPDIIMAKISKILYIVTQSEWGGAGRYVVDLANALPRDQFLVSVAAGGDGFFFSKLSSDVSTHVIKHMVREINPLEDLLCFFELVRFFKKERPDIVHLNSSKAGVLGTFAAQIAGVKKIIYTAHGFVFNEPLPTWKKTFYRLSERISGMPKDMIICVSDFDRQTALELHIAPITKLITIHNGITHYPLASRETARIRLGILEKATIIGTVANLYPTKGLPYLLEAAAILNKKLDIQLVIIGRGNEETSLRQKISTLAIYSNVTIVTNIPAGEAAALIPAFDVFVLPSIKEGLPYTIIEAMAAEVPIVATRVGGVPELIEHNKNGLLVKPKNPEALAFAINQLLRDRALCKQFTLASHSKAGIEFSLQQMVQKTIAVYQ